MHQNWDVVDGSGAQLQHRLELVLDRLDAGIRKQGHVAIPHKRVRPDDSTRGTRHWRSWQSCDIGRNPLGCHWLVGAQGTTGMSALCQKRTFSDAVKNV